MSRDAGTSTWRSGPEGIRSLVSAMGTAVVIAGAFALPAHAQTVVELEARGDSDVQGGAPDQNYGSHGLIHVGNPDKTVFVYFDLSAVPQNAIINRAQLVMTVAASSGPNPTANPVTVGGVKDRWREAQITSATQSASQR